MDLITMKIRELQGVVGQTCDMIDNTARALNCQPPEIASAAIDLDRKYRSEKASRLYYQDIVYDVCNLLDRYHGKKPGEGIVCGTAAEPTKQVQDAVANLCLWVMGKAAKPADLDQGEEIKPLRQYACPDGYVYHAKARELQAKLIQANAIVEPLNRLRESEGASVTITCPNPEGPPNEAIEVSDDWTGWENRRFDGHTLAECLAAAEKTKTDSLPNLLNCRGLLKPVKVGPSPLIDGNYLFRETGNWWRATQIKDAQASGPWIVDAIPVVGLSGEWHGPLAEGDEHYAEAMRDGNGRLLRHYEPKAEAAR